MIYHKSSIATSMLWSHLKERHNDVPRSPPKLNVKKINSLWIKFNFYLVPLFDDYLSRHYLLH